MMVYEDAEIRHMHALAPTIMSLFEILQAYE